MGDAAPPPQTREFLIVNRRGLHARAAARFVQCVERFDTKVMVSNDHASVDGGSIMGLMMLAAVPGSMISVSADGPDADAVLAALQTLIDSRFGEED
jgi:phosphocarrier protein